MLQVKFLETHEDGVSFYTVESDIEGKCVLQVETGILYGGVCITETDPYTYEEVDDPNYVEDKERTDDGLLLDANNDETETESNEVSEDVVDDGSHDEGIKVIQSKLVL